MDFIFKVDPIRRNIKVPDGFTVLTMDHNVHKLVFVCPYFEDFAFDSASIVFMVDAPDGRQYSIPAEEYESFPNSPSPYVKFTLTLKSYITSVVGYISFCITADIISSGNVIEKSWHTKNITIGVGGHIDNDDSGEIPEEDVPTINQRLNNLDSKVGRLQTTVNGMANGSPTPVATVAEMTDESAVYLYTGSETGYTAGNWYYYDGSAWTAGGTYGGAITDSTLTDPALPANSKAAGDAIGALDTRVTALESDTSGGLTADIKSALLACFANVAWANENGQTYYDALDAALNPPAGLVSISAVYTQGGTVYDTASLDSLKSDLVVTAHYDNATTQVITNYTLSGTLTEGTSTITVSYGGKTTTFTVTVSVFNTSPAIAETGKTLQTNFEAGNTSGGCYTEAYTYTLDIDTFKETQYYDSSNNYSNTNGALWKINYCFPNTAGVTFSSRGKSCVYNSNGQGFAYVSTTFDTSEHTYQDPRYKAGYFNTPDNDNKIDIKFSFSYADRESCYAYWVAPSSGIMPIGVTAGDIIFAGSNTPYYGCHNISEAVVGT